MPKARRPAAHASAVHAQCHPAGATRAAEQEQNAAHLACLDDVHTALESVGEGAETAAAGKDLRLDHDLVVADLGRRRDGLRARESGVWAGHERRAGVPAAERTSSTLLADRPKGTLTPLAFMSAALWYCVRGKIVRSGQPWGGDGRGWRGRARTSWRLRFRTNWRVVGAKARRVCKGAGVQLSCAGVHVVL